MAVYQGARRRAPLPFGLDALAGAGKGTGRDGGRPSAETTGRATRRSPAAMGRTTAGRPSARRLGLRAARPSSVGIALAVIVVVFIAAFLSLSQSVRVAATGYDIVRLVSEHDRLLAIRQDLQSDVERLRSEPAIRKQALDHGLGQLGAPLIVQAR
jgi:hypothetical protein